MTEIWTNPQSPADIGGYLADVRRLQGLTQAELAEATGLPRRYVVELEAGKDTQYSQRLFAVFQRLGVEVNLRAHPAKSDPEEFDW
ncbi:helix-turn-helix domain-containing protein [Ornithinimicrobium sp. INDO-MA30-4]|uniref:helix-turn-helix domain-containing protein n=1 Tax=Ornithinimicrobium sp. INDO-MA30-4 TaxID=2908651 RepID=UPI001F3EF1BB|nr:helix-turn-helix domain-containing protein [Ornithinimicrobium sp. INDO-MA30-4]UJH70404.1 helix-turn-helix domain-containing protein [Ornithinimicrobium sp. INDO-MA30-4]